MSVVTQLGFGRYKGQPLSAVPSGALTYYLEWPALRPETREAITAELATRAERPDAPRPAPLVSPAPMPAASDTLRRVAFDLVVVGEQTLLAEQPARMAVVRNAGILLRTVLQRLPAATPAAPMPPPQDAVAGTDDDRSIPF